MLDQLQELLDNSGKQLVARVVNKSHAKLRFTMIGRAHMVNNNLVGFNLMDAVLNFNKEEQWFFKLIHDAMDYETNLASLAAFEFNKTNQNRMSKAYQSLKEKNLVRRVKKGVFMINPEAIIYPANHDKNKERWDSLV